jgi:mono/diheme cytochrome c family protein
VLLALSSAQKAGLAGMGAAFIVFALISSMVIPHYRPTFPARLLSVFLGLVGVFTVGMLLTVFYVARETGEEEAKAAKPEPPAPTAGETGTTPAAPKGNPVAGKAIFTSPNIGCFGCHTLKAAGATGTIGPNLDQAKPDLALIVERVTNGKSPMPPFKGRLSPAQINDVAAFVYESTHTS